MGFGRKTTMDKVDAATESYRRENARLKTENARLQRAVDAYRETMECNDPVNAKIIAQRFGIQTTARCTWAL